MNIQQRFAKWSNGTLTAALLVVAVGTILAAIYIHNPLLKAGLLAYEILP